MGYLDKINSPKDLSCLNNNELESLRDEIFNFLIKNVSATGGHLGPNLGIIELTIALYKVFLDKADIIFDTGHQSYVHKLLTGRKDFSKLRHLGGLSGYPSRKESKYDILESSHASASIAWALGILKANKLKGLTERHAIAVIGDGALTGGLAWEAINNLDNNKDLPLIVVLNDNGRSYEPTIGSFAAYLNKLRLNGLYYNSKSISHKIFKKFGAEKFYNAANLFLKSAYKKITLKDYSLFSSLGFKYIGPLDGHNIKDLIGAFQYAKKYKKPVLVHIITKKGNGYTPALKDIADNMHAVGKIDPDTGKPISTAAVKTWTSVFSYEILNIARKNDKIIGLTAAMKIPVGLYAMSQEFPERVIDVGIAEEFCVSYASALAYGGYHPVVCIYSTFLNRAFDQVLMEVGLHKAGVTFVLDRAGVTGNDGASHNGQWDLSVLSIVPGIQIAAPRDENTLKKLLNQAAKINNAPTVIRYPKGEINSDLPYTAKLKSGADILYKPLNKSDIAIIGLGVFAKMALDIANILYLNGFSATVIDPKWIWPIKNEFLTELNKYRLIITLEDALLKGGWGEALKTRLFNNKTIDIISYGLKDEYFEHANRDQILDANGLNAKDISQNILAYLSGKSATSFKNRRQIASDLNSKL